MEIDLYSHISNQPSHMPYNNLALRRELQRIIDNKEQVISIHGMITPGSPVFRKYNWSLIRFAILRNGPQVRMADVNQAPKDVFPYLLFYDTPMLIRVLCDLYQLCIGVNRLKGVNLLKDNKDRDVYIEQNTMSIKAIHYLRGMALYYEDKEPPLNELRGAFNHYMNLDEVKTRVDEDHLNKITAWVMTTWAMKPIRLCEPIEKTWGRLLIEMRDEVYERYEEMSRVAREEGSTEGPQEMMERAKWLTTYGESDDEEEEDMTMEWDDEEESDEEMLS
ncbi:hypothetical protein BD769DRAFT_1745879 [Suillus cothurnatus]|nr:hypothetical protein BD769DRAFT_1745879 [Suillus cothurnatus]